MNLLRLLTFPFRATGTARKGGLLKQRRRFQAADFLVVSRPGSGRTWLRVLISRLYQRKYGLPELEIVDLDNLHAREPRVPKILFSHGKDYPLNVETEAKAVRLLAAKKVVLLVRNPLDTIITLHFHVANRKPKRHQRQMARLSIQESVEIRLPRAIEFLNRWHRYLSAIPHALVIRYEDLRADPQAVLERLGAFLGAGFTVEQIREAIDFASFERLKEMEKANAFNTAILATANPDDPESFKVRRGKIGGYRDYLPAEQALALEGMVERELIPFYGYRGARIEPMQAQRGNGHPQAVALSGT